MKRLLVDGTYPVVLDGRHLKPTGPHQGIIEFLCGLAHESPGNGFHQSMHDAFRAGREFSHDAGVYFFTLIDPTNDFEAYRTDPQFIEALQTLEHPDEPLWHASINGVWDGFVATYIRKSSLDKIIRLAHGEAVTAGIQELSEDEWDLRYGWAAITGLLPSRVRQLEQLANDRHALLQTWLNQGLLYDDVHYQIDATASAELRRILKQLDDAGLV